MMLVSAFGQIAVVNLILHCHKFVRLFRYSSHPILVVRCFYSFNIRAVPSR